MKTCPHCGNDDETQIEEVWSHRLKRLVYYVCNVCSKTWKVDTVQ